MIFENGLAAACLRGRGSGRSGRTTISSLSFRMFMLVFPVCHVLNYEYAENNNNDDNNDNKKKNSNKNRAVASPGVQSERVFVLVCVCVGRG